MAAKSRIRWGRIVVCYILLSVVVLTCGSYFRPLDEWLCARVAPLLNPALQGKAVSLTDNPEDCTRTISREVPTTRLVSQPVAMLEMSPEKIGELYSSSTLWDVMTFSVVLNKIAGAGYRHVVLSSPLLLDGGIGAGAHMTLTPRLKDGGAFEHLVLGVHGRTTAQAEFTPPQLSAHAIPAHQVIGNKTQLPFANRKFENDFDSSMQRMDLNWAADWLDDELLTQVPSALEDRSFPLLVRWNEEILPTLPLRLAMLVRRCKPQDVYVELGKSIRIGQLELPIDDYGRLVMQGAVTQSADLVSILSDSESASAPQDAVIAVVMQPMKEKDDVTPRMQSMAATLSVLCSDKMLEMKTVTEACPPALLYTPYFSSLSSRIICVLLLLFVALRFLPSFSPGMRFVTMLLWLGYIGVACRSSVLTLQWGPLGLMLATWGLVYVLVPMLKPIKKRTIFRSHR